MMWQSKVITRVKKLYAGNYGVFEKIIAEEVIIMNLQMRVVLRNSIQFLERDLHNSLQND